ncbi:MAG: sigma-70 family RNA polymerase sigma factor [Myxococcales bacterium]|nr:sigma-70 family RNA polymerase sigma factor [Myxococcales bacterium]
MEGTADPAAVVGAEGARRLVAHFFRHESGRLIASLVRRHGAAQLEVIEDAVQGALAAALSTWARRGIPDNPSAWLTRVAQNGVIDQLRRRTRDRDLKAQLGEAGDSHPPASSPPAEVAFVDEIDDDELRMLFVCCDPALDPRSQLVLALKWLGGFGAREIATRLFITTANAEKIVGRGRARLEERWSRREAGVPEPAPDELAERLSAVQAVIYLLFNEGYSSQREDEVIVRELCEEALRLGQRLVAQRVGDVPESWALLALMHFHIARLDARLDGEGGLLLLEEQDRSRWDREHIHRGMMALGRASAGERFSRYHAEAAVMAEHCLAPSFAETRWGEIVSLYELLERQAPSPLYTLNRAIALAEWRGPEAGLEVLEAMTPPAWLLRYYLWDAALGELLRRAGRQERAASYLRRAIDAAPTRAERRIFEARLQRCEAGDASR